MRIKLLKQFGLNSPGTIMDLPESSAVLLVERKAAELVKDFADQAPENRAMKSQKVARK